MLYSYTIQEIRQNINTGVEYEIALFYKLLSPAERQIISDAINSRFDRTKIYNIIEHTDIAPILNLPINTGLSSASAGSIPPLSYQGLKKALHPIGLIILPYFLYISGT